jgi:hypothetical protein
MKNVTLILGCLLLSVIEIHAQQAPRDLKSLAILPLPLPPGELISQAPDPGQWVVSSASVGPAPASDASQPNQPPPKLSVLTFTKANKLYRIDSTDSSGRTMVRWKDHQLQATYLGTSPIPLVSYTPSFGSDGRVIYYMDFSKSDFPEFSWISARNYLGQTKLATGMAMVFKAKISAKGVAMAVLSMSHVSPADAVAVVDVATHHPVMLQVEDELLQYQFNQGSADVTLPPEVKQQFDGLRRAMKQAANAPPG